MEAAKKFAGELEHTPLVYAEINDKLPGKHRDKLNNRKIIGSALDGYIVKGEDGIDMLVGDYLIYEDSYPDIIEKIKANRDEASASWEIHQALADTNGNIYDGFYGATAVMDSSESAFRHHALVVADKSNSTTIEKDVDVEKYEELIREKTSAIDELNSKLSSYEEQIKIKEEKINELVRSNNSLKSINNKFSKLIR